MRADAIRPYGIVGPKKVYCRGGNLPPAVFCYEKCTVFGLSHPGALQQGGVGRGKGGLFFGFIQGQQQ